MDEYKFTEVVRQYQKLLFHIAYTMLRDQQDCADAVQEALMLAWRGRHQLRQETATKAWLTRILVNTCNSLRRKRKRVAFAELGEIEAPPRVDNLALHEALTRLAPELRLPTVMFYLEGFTVEEIGKILHVPTGTVKSRMVRARKALGGMLSKEDFAWN